MPQPLRVFVSSPGDVVEERLRADLVIDKLSQEYGRFFTIASYRWEHEPMLATGHFQDIIEPPSKFDIVVLILWSRLGTDLPERYTGIDNRSPVTGTEWEYENALGTAREKGAPDIVAFRNVSPAPVDMLNLDVQKKSLEQIEALNVFWARHFADRGTFIAAYDTYRSLEEFSSRLENTLRKLIDRRVKKLGLTTGNKTERIWPGPPFRGLQAYEFRHAAIYFGRDATVAKAMEQLAAQARAGTAFLLVSGASGSGKSSLVKAALVPRLMKPQRIAGAGFVRRLEFRPSQGGADLVLALVEALLKGPAAEDIGLPELLKPGQRVADLAKNLTSPENVTFAFTGALGEVTEASRTAARILDYEEAKLILVVDQLEELFTTASITADERRRFMRLLGALAKSGAVWVVATIRADFWHRAAELTELTELSQGQGRLDVAAPSAAELAEMIRRPAEAAAIFFERHPKSGLLLDAVLAEHAAAAPGVLPLLSFTLDALYREDIEKPQAAADKKKQDVEQQANKDGAEQQTAKEVGPKQTGAGEQQAERLEQQKEQPDAAKPKAGAGQQTTDGEKAGEETEKAADKAKDDADQKIGHTLTFATYEKIGELEGAIATRAEEIVTALEPAARTALPRVLRALVTVSTDGRQSLVSRAESLARFPEGSDARTVVDALTTARLLVASGDGSQATVRVAHEALISRWQRAANLLITDRRDLETRDVIERQMARWAAATGRNKRKLLLQEPDLANALDLRQRWGDELPEPVRHFIKLSDAAAKLAARIRWAIAAVVIVSLGALAAAAFGALNVAETQRNDALIAESRFLAHDARVAVQSGNATLGVLLALSGLPGDIAHPKRPFVKDAEYALEDAFANLRERSLMQGHTGVVWSAVYSPDGARVVTASDDKTARLWDASGKQIAVLQGHTATVWSAAFSPDGTRIVTASSDGTARLWDGATGNPIAVLTGHTDVVSSASFSSDQSGSLIVTASDDHTARVWDGHSGGPVAVLTGHGGVVTSAQFSPDGTRVVTASTDKTARVWDAHSGAAILTLSGHANWVSVATFSPHGERIATASWDNTARLWDANSGALIAELKDHDGPVMAAAFSPDGTRLVTASTDSTARLWNGATGAAIDVFKGHTNWVTSATFSPDGREVLTASNDDTARIWAVENGANVGVLLEQNDMDNSAAFSPDGKTIVTASTDDTARVWTTDVEASNAVLRQHTDDVTSAAFSHDGTRFATGSLDGTVIVWDAKTLSPAPPIKVGRVRSVEFSPDDSQILTAAEDQTARLWDAKTGAPVREFDGHTDVVNNADFSPDGKLVVGSSDDHTAIVWDAATGQKLQTLTQDNWVTWAGFAPAGQQIAPNSQVILTTSWDETARLWDANTGAQLKMLKGDQGRLGAGAFSHDGHRIVTAGWDNTARIWNVDSGAQIAVLSGHTNVINSVAFSPDDTRVLTASLDHTAALWDVASGEAILVLNGHDNWVSAAGFSKDGTQVITASADDTARLWIMPVHCQPLIVAAHAGELRAPTASERAQYFLSGPAAGGGTLDTFNRWFAPLLPKEGETCQ